jgi:hypothetical protein
MDIKCFKLFAWVTPISEYLRKKAFLMYRFLLLFEYFLAGWEMNILGGVKILNE